MKAETIMEYENQVDALKNTVDEQNFRMEDLETNLNNTQNAYEVENTNLIQCQNELMEMTADRNTLSSEFEQTQQQCKFI